VRLLSRRNKSFSHQYPDIVEALGELPENTVVDREIVALDESGRPNFNLLQRTSATKRHASISSSSIFSFARVVISPACR
jgi:bifunctional non-homologous end joining protein LigD